AIPLDVPIEQPSMHLGSVPHLYPLARLNDQYPRYAALLADTNSADIYVFALGSTMRRESVTSDKMRRTRMGGWSQARYQRHADHWHKLQMKDVVEAIDKVVTQECVDRIVVGIVVVERQVHVLLLPTIIAHR